VNVLEAVIAFRERLVEYRNLVARSTGRNAVSVTDDAKAWIVTEQAWQNREYGRLFRVLNQWGSASVLVPAIGTVSHDVVRDAINEAGRLYDSDVARYAVQHLDNVIGRLESEADEQRDPEAIYRLTSPVFWLQRLAALLRWLWGSTRRRVATVAGTVALAILTAVVSGWAQAFFAK
jgi:hypothetical protein